MPQLSAVWREMGVFAGLIPRARIQAAGPRRLTSGALVRGRFDAGLSLSSSGFELDSWRVGPRLVPSARANGLQHPGKRGKPSEGARREARRLPPAGQNGPESGRVVIPQHCSCRVVHIVDGMSSAQLFAIPRIEERIEEQLKWASFCVAFLLDGLFAPESNLFSMLLLYPILR